MRAFSFRSRGETMLIIYGDICLYVCVLLSVFLSVQWRAEGGREGGGWIWGWRGGVSGVLNKGGVIHSEREMRS